MRKGFTLVEILIVIIVMSILGAMMTYSSSEAISSNKAAEIVIKLRNLKIAAMQMYVDKLDIWQGSTTEEINKAKDAFTMGEVKTHLNDDNGYDSKYVIITDKGKKDTSTPYANRKWYIVYNFDTQEKDVEKVKEKLAKRAKTDDLLGSTGTLDHTSGFTERSGDDKYFNNNDAAVLLQIRKAN